MGRQDSRFLCSLLVDYWMYNKYLSVYFYFAFASNKGHPKIKPHVAVLNTFLYDICIHNRRRKYNPSGKYRL